MKAGHLDSHGVANKAGSQQGVWEEQILSKVEDFGTVRDGVSAAGLQVYPDESGLVFIPLSPVEVTPITLFPFGIFGWLDIHNFPCQ